MEIMDSSMLSVPASLISDCPTLQPVKAAASRMADIMGMNLFFMFLLNAYTFVFYVLGLLLFLALPRDRDIPWFLTPEDVLPMP